MIIGTLFFISLISLYTAVAPDWMTLRATRGSVGAVRGMKAARQGIDIGAATSKNSGKGKKPGAASPSGTGTSSGPSLWEGALSGWREGVRAARVRRDEGKDLWMRTSRAAGFVWTSGRHVVIGARDDVLYFTLWVGDRRDQWRNRGEKPTEPVSEPAGEPDPQPAPPQGPPPGPTGPPPGPRPDNPPPHPKPGEGDKYADWNIVDAEIVEDDPQTTTPTNPATPNNPALAGKDTNMSINLTELSNPNEMASEAGNVMQVAAAYSELGKTLEEWQAAIADRVSGLDWGTDDLNVAAAALAEADPKETDTFMAAMKNFTDAIDRAQSFGEIADQEGARGNVDAFRAA